jgi:hypothetical protein
MTGIIKALQQAKFQCYAPNGAEPLVPSEPEDEKRLTSFAPFEDPKPKKNQVAVEESPPPIRQLFRYFVDGSMRTTNAGYIVDPDGRYLPIFIAQIAVAATRLDEAGIRVEEYRNRNVFFLPYTFDQANKEEAKCLVKRAASSSCWPLDLDFGCYVLKEQTEPLDADRKKVLSDMHEMEIDLIKDLADSEKVTRDDMLMIDGSLQFYRNLDRAREAFRNVVGVAKSFDLHRQVGTGKNSKQVGPLVAELKHRHRTPARKVTVARTNLAIGAWYLRLHSAKHLAGLGVDDGVVKLELFPDGATSRPSPLPTDRCNLISRHILALRHPTTPSADPRWASHLYPIHLTERYIKTRFRDERTIRAYL